MIRLFRRKDANGADISKNWYFHLNGQRKSTRSTNKKEAAEIAARLYNRAAADKDSGLKLEATIEEVVNMFVENQEHSDSLFSQASASKKRLLGQFKPDELYRLPKREYPFALDPKRRWSSLSNRDLSNIRKHRLREGYKPATINKEKAHLAQMQKLCKKEWGIKINHELDFSDLNLKVSKKVRYATVEDERKLIASLNPRDMTYCNNCTWENAPAHQRVWAVDNFHLLILYLDTGVRASEGCSLLWDDIDTTTWVGIRVWRSKTKRWDMLQMTDRLRECLQSRWEYRNERKSVYVFPHKDDPKKHRTGYLGSLRNGIERAGLNEPHLVERYGKFTVHSLRDSFATRLTEQGMVPSELMHLLGHSNEEMSMKYIHIRPKDAISRGISLRNESAETLLINSNNIYEDVYEKQV